jgi:hypothetical protein
MTQRVECCCTHQQNMWQHVSTIAAASTAPAAAGLAFGTMAHGHCSAHQHYEHRYSTLLCCSVSSSPLLCLCVFVYCCCCCCCCCACLCRPPYDGWATRRRHAWTPNGRCALEWAGRGGGRSDCDCDCDQISEAAAVGTAVPLLVDEVVPQHCAGGRAAIQWCAARLHR